MSKKLTESQLLLAQHLKELGLKPVLEHAFCDGRKWAFDVAVVDMAFACEADGGKWKKGHRWGSRVDDENEKINTAQMMGWKVFKFTNEVIDNGEAKEFIAQWLREPNRIAGVEEET